MFYSQNHLWFHGNRSCASTSVALRYQEGLYNNTSRHTISTDHSGKTEARGRAVQEDRRQAWRQRLRLGNGAHFSHQLFLESMPFSLVDYWGHSFLFVVLLLGFSHPAAAVVC